MTSAFEAAAAARAAQEQQAQAANTSAPDNSPMVEEGEDSGLFGGEKLPGLFNKFVVIGEKRTGVIAKPPTQRQARDMKGRPKYWDADADNGKGAVTNVNTGRKLNDSVIVLQTDYRYTPQEIADRQVDPLDVEEDTGLRGIWASGDQKRAIMRAIRVAKVRSEKEMVGMRLTIWRTGKVPAGDFETWTYEAELTPNTAA